MIGPGLKTYRGHCEYCRAPMKLFICDYIFFTRDDRTHQAHRCPLGDFPNPTLEGKLKVFQQRVLHDGGPSWFVPEKTPLRRESRTP